MLLHISSYDLVVDSLYLWPHLKIGDVSKIHLNGFIASCQGSLSTAYDASRCTSAFSLPFCIFFIHSTWELPTEPPKKIIVVKCREFLVFHETMKIFCEMEIWLFRLPLSFTTPGFRWFFFGLPWAGDSWMPGRFPEIIRPETLQFDELWRRCVVFFNGFFTHHTLCYSFQWWENTFSISFLDPSWWQAKGLGLLHSPQVVESAGSMCVLQ